MRLKQENKTREQLMEEFKLEHPFQYNLVRVLDGEVTHINSLYKGYNCTEREIQPCDINFRKRIICDTQEEIDAAISCHDFTGRQDLYILTKINTRDIKQICQSDLED